MYRMFRSLDGRNLEVDTSKQELVENLAATPPSSSHLGIRIELQYFDHMTTPDIKIAKVERTRSETRVIYPEKRAEKFLETSGMCQTELGLYCYYVFNTELFQKFLVEIFRENLEEKILEKSAQNGLKARCSQKQISVHLRRVANVQRTLKSLRNGTN